MADDENPSPNRKSDGKPKPIGSIRNGVNVALRQILALIGLVMIIVAIPIAFVTPLLPIGLPIAIVGATVSGARLLLDRVLDGGSRW